MDTEENGGEGEDDTYEEKFQSESSARACSRYRRIA